VTARLLSVNVVNALIPDVRGDLEKTAIDKRPVVGPVAVSAADAEQVGLAGDQVVDTRHHGGPDKAVYAYAVEDLRWWADDLGRDLPPGTFGENLTTEGLDVTGAVIGERWRLGSEVELEVTYARIPCRTFHGWMDEPHWVKRFSEHGAPGAYLRVVRGGAIEAGDPVEVLHRPDHGVTIGETFPIAKATDDQIEALLAMPGLGHALERAARLALAGRERHRVRT
jgi:MOSC domain-containing protein YiiM